jgi:anti-sigma B factor antagonist
MTTGTTTADVRTLGSGVSAIAIHGDVTAASENALMDAYNDATRSGARSVVLDFSGLDYMNSGGIGLLVTLLVRTQRQGQRLLATGLSDHYREIFSLTRLDEAIELHDSPSEAAAAAG